MKSNMTKKIVGALNSFSFCFNMRQKTQFPDAKFICIHNAPIRQLNWKGHKANPLAPVPTEQPSPSPSLSLGCTLYPAWSCTTNGWRACKLRRVANESSRTSALPSECVSAIRVFNVPHIHTLERCATLCCMPFDLPCVYPAATFGVNFNKPQLQTLSHVFFTARCPSVPQLSLFLLTAFLPCLLVANFA